MKWNYIKDAVPESLRYCVVCYGECNMSASEVVYFDAELNGWTNKYIFGLVPDGYIPLHNDDRWIYIDDLN